MLLREALERFVQDGIGCRRRLAEFDVGLVDGKGRLVGVNFDRVWENVANDFGYEPSIARNVNVDVRYMLWMLDRVERARALLDELGVKPRETP